MMVVMFGLKYGYILAMNTRDRISQILKVGVVNAIA
jgi:hypothetical protein